MAGAGKGAGRNLLRSQEQLELLNFSWTRCCKAPPVRARLVLEDPGLPSLDLPRPWTFHGREFAGVLPDFSRGVCIPLDPTERSEIFPALLKSWEFWDIDWLRECWCLFSCSLLVFPSHPSPWKKGGGGIGGNYG